MSKKIIQIEDNSVLLQEMWEAQLKADPLYKPGNYWDTYSKVFIPELKTKGLHDFKRRKFSILGSFGATDLNLLTLRNLPTWLEKLKTKKILWHAVPHISDVIEWILKPIERLYLKQFSANDVFDYFYPRISEKFSQKGWDLKNFSMSDIGNPDEKVPYDGKIWSRHHLEMASIFIEALEKSEFPKDGTLVEIGPGIGRNTEFFATAYPDATIILFDIVPQIYVLNQYLKKRFPERFISYEQTRSVELKKISSYKGKILLFPTWDIPNFKKLKIDYFWNSASFQEMEPFIVKNYLEIIKSMSPDYIYLNQLPTGNYWGENPSENGGTKEPVTESLYQKGLESNYVRIHTYATNYLLRKPDYYSYIFRKKNETN